MKKITGCILRQWLTVHKRNCSAIFKDSVLTIGNSKHICFNFDHCSKLWKKVITIYTSFRNKLKINDFVDFPFCPFS